ncbi:hypothetical protein [Actinoplanes friuliensis]|uniref:Uncharacterized protein n=1 Tax=Actinoplanes friuliensis DSM 7358 TaxID=1246995 RepID=U5VY06_9ACTN|nr:hypothetical protein [Actinoplanes friuliensis]AGZ41657.1 hypothetical protein AFR_16895 [Actinoplanes friuliensis DSM 7358]
MVSASDFRRGDRLLLSCEPCTVEVTGSDRFFVYVRWPWGEPDPGSEHPGEQSRAFARDPASEDFQDQVWRLDPPPADLTTGDVCTLFAPPTKVIVRAISRFDPPLDIGRLPRPSAALHFRPAGRWRWYADTGDTIYLDLVEPLVIEHVGRLRKWIDRVSGRRLSSRSHT